MDKEHPQPGYIYESDCIATMSEWSPAQWWQVETTAGTEFFPVELIGKEPADSDAFELYCEGQVLSWEKIEGFGARLSAPGYLDCTEWTVFSSESDAEAYLENMYPEDEED